MKKKKKVTAIGSFSSKGVLLWIFPKDKKDENKKRKRNSKLK